MKVNLVSESIFFPKGHGVHTAFLNVLALLRQNHQKVVVNSLKKADVVHIHTLGLLGLYKLLTSPAVVVSAHVVPDSFKGSLIGEKYWGKYAQKYLRFFYSRANRVIAVAPQVKEELEAIGVTSHIEVIPNAIDTNHFKKSAEKRVQGRKKYGYTDTDFIAVAAGQVQTRKGVTDFIEIAKQLPDVKFIWAGGTPFQGITDQDKKLKRALQNLPSNVNFIGIVPYSDMPMVYNASDVFCFPSYQENAPMAVLEAGSVELPLILRDLPEYTKLYGTDYETAGTLEGFTKFLNLYQKDSKKRGEDGKKGRELALRFSFDALYHRLMDTYNGAIVKKV